MKLIIKLAIVALIANATWRVGSAYASHYRFKDAVAEATQYRGDRTDAQVHDKVFQLASDYDIPVTDENLTITTDENHTIVDGEYNRAILLAPGFTYDWRFKIHVDTFVLNAPPHIKRSGE